MVDEVRRKRLILASGRRTGQAKNLNQHRRKLWPYCFGYRAKVPTTLGRFETQLQLVDRKTHTGIDLK